MKKQIIPIVFSLFIVMACAPRREYQHEVELKESLVVIVDSFVIDNPEKEVYEMYIDKQDPHNAFITLYAGERPLTESENYHNRQKSVSYSLSNNKKVHIYTGLERYVEDTDENVKPVMSKRNMNDVFWIVTDSFTVYKVYKNYEPVYPFMPVILDKPKFVSPTLP